MLVKDLAERTGVPAHVIRYYTRRGMLSPQRDPKNQYRKYSDTDISRVLFIRRAKGIGLTLRDIETILESVEKGISPLPQARRLIQRRASQNKARIKQLIEKQIRIEKALALWEEIPNKPGTDTWQDLLEATGASDTDALSAQATKGEVEIIFQNRAFD